MLVMSACERGDLDLIESFLKSRKSTLLAADDSLSTMLHRASWAGQVQVILMLLHAGADVRARDPAGLTVLHSVAQGTRCARTAKTERVHVAGTEVEAETWTMADANWAEAARVLVEAGAGADAGVALDLDGQTPLHEASRVGAVGVMRVLIGAGASHAAVDKEARTPLHLAVLLGHADAVRLLIDAGADMNVKDGLGWAPLHNCIGQLPMLSLLLQAGANVRAVDNMGKTPLHHASSRGSVRAVRLLLEAGAAVSAADGVGSTPLHAAVWEGRSDAVRPLLAAGAELEACDQFGCTPLHIAVAEDRTDVIRLLLEAGANASAAGDKWTPLHVAASKGRDAAVRMLLEAGAKPGAKDRAGLSPLHCACGADRPSTVLALLSAAGSPTTDELLTTPRPRTAPELWLRPSLGPNVWLFLAGDVLWLADDPALAVAHRFRCSLGDHDSALTRKVRAGLVDARRLRDLLRPMIDPRAKELRRKRFAESRLRLLPWHLALAVLQFLVLTPAPGGWGRMEFEAGLLWDGGAADNPLSLTYHYS